ncbi:unnamed protein product, partial [Closterium sp. Yama58-4]
PKWPSASFVAVDVLVTAMAYRTPVVALGDKAGVLRWWDVASGAAGTHALNRGAIRRLRFAPTLVNSSSCGRIAVMFNDYTFALFDLDEGEFVAGAMPSETAACLQVLEMDWLPLQGPSAVGPSAARQLLCVAAADGTVRLLDMATNAPLKQPFYRPLASRLAVWHRFRPSPLCSVALMPAPCALALRLLLQMGVHPAWLEAPLPPGAQGDGGELGDAEEEAGEEGRARGDLLSFLLHRGQLPGGVGDPAMAEVLLKGLQPMRLAGQLMGVEAARAYSKVCGGGVAARCACVAANYGDIQEAHFWLLLPHALRLLAQIYSSRAQIYSSRAQIYSSRAQIYSFQAQIYSSRAQIYSSRAQIYSSRAQIYSSRALIYYSSRAQIYSSRAQIYSSRAQIYSSRAQIYSSRAQIYSSRAQIYSSRAQIYSSRAQIYSS